MVRTVYSPEYCLQYLEQYASQEVFVIGLILGQVTNARESVIHLARTPEEKASDTASESSYTSEKPETVRNLLGVSEAWVADHAKHVTRMLPGGLFVQGIFITSDEDIFEDPNHFSKVKTVLNYTHKVLGGNQYMYGNYTHSNERLILHMSTDTKVLTCKSVEVGSSGKTTMKPVEWKFLPKLQQWQRLECYYEFDEMYPVIVKKSGISVKHQFQQILESAHKAIESSVMFIDGELKDGSEALEHLTKKKKPKSGAKTTQDTLKSMQVSLFVPFDDKWSILYHATPMRIGGGVNDKPVLEGLPPQNRRPQITLNNSYLMITGIDCITFPQKHRSALAELPLENSMPESVEYLECDGSIHFSGVVSSSIFMYPKATVSETIVAVKQDIIRSLASRFTMHCDALIDDNLLPEEKVCFNEPPRRVLVPVGSLYLCDYLFPGEAPAEALLSVRELLDLQITESDVISDIETPADTSEFDALDRDTSSEELLATPQEASQLMYITGICFAMFVLLVSILVHYYDAIVAVISRVVSKP